MSANDVSLVINGEAFGGWLSVRMEAGIERQARSFALEVTDRWAGLVQSRRVRPGQACEVYIGTDRVLTGHVDATPVEYDGTRIKLSVQGRSKTADLIDCSPITPPNQWRGKKLEAIASALAAPYGVEVINNTDTGAPFADFTLVSCDSVFDTIDRMMRLRHVLSSDDEYGRMVLIDVGALRATTALELGKNVLGASCKLDFKDVFTQYVCVAQRPIGDAEAPEAGAEEEGEVSDAHDGPEPENLIEFARIASTSAAQLLGRRRLLVVKAGGQADKGNCQDRVEYERAHRQAKALETAYTVSGWRQASGELWQPNMLVQVSDSVVGLDQQMLIAELAYILDDSGLRTELRVGPVDGYVTKAAKTQKKRGGGSDWSDATPAR